MAVSVCLRGRRGGVAACELSLPGHGGGVAAGCLLFFGRGGGAGCLLFFGRGGSVQLMGPGHFVVGVRAAAGDQVDAAAQVDDLVAGFDLAQQRGLEIDQSDIEDQPRAVQVDKLPRRGLEGLGTGARRDEHAHVEVVADDAADDAFERQNGDVERLLFRLRRLRTAAQGADTGADEQFQNEFLHGMSRGSHVRLLPAKIGKTIKNRNKCGFENRIRFTNFGVLWNFKKVSS